MENIKFCPYCGAQLHEQAVVCVGCGRKVPTKNAVTDVNSKGLNALSFFFPFIGLVLYLCMMTTQPVKAKGIGKWALIGFITGVLAGVLFTVLGFAAAIISFNSAANYYYF